MKSMAPDRLEALADVMDAGRPAAEALADLARLGGAVAAWARPLEAGVRAGVPLGMVLAQRGVLSLPELTWVGGAEHAGTPSSLRVVAAQRRTRHTRARALWGAMAVPAFFTILSVAVTRFLLAVLGGDGTGWIGDLLPLAMVGGAVWWGLKDRDRQLGKLAGLPLAGRWIGAHQAARVAESLGAALSRAPDPSPAAQAQAFTEAARLSDTPALEETARRLGSGRPLSECLPAALFIGEPLALCLAAGVAAGDLPRRLAIYAATVDARLTAQLRSLVRMLAWLVVVWVNLRAMWAITDIDFFSGGLPGVPVDLSGGGIPGVNDRDLEEFIREVGL